ncbi:hypothetical protein LguiA_024302 [Lonicera macranthoides]
MSLHLGNLSSRVRRDELERVFRRFGRCNVQVKDKFGFVVYDVRASAEKAMRTLQGKNICGEPITVSWSNRQPGGAVQRFTRSGRFYESSQRGRRDYRVGFRQTGGNSRRFNSTEQVDDARSPNNKGVTREKYHKVWEDLPDEGGDRWGEQIGNLSNENEAANDMGFDRYEPYNDDDIKDGDEIHHGGSPPLEKSQERRGTEQINEIRLNHLGNAKPQQTCYVCGELGHKMRNCPQENASKNKKLSRFDFLRENEEKYRGRGEPGLERPRSISRGRLPLERDDVSMRKNKSYRKTPSSRRHRRLLSSRHSPIAEETHRSVRNENGEKKRNRRETGSPERQRAKKSKALSKSSTTSSRSSSHSKYRSVASRSGSQSSSSRPNSASHSPRSGGSKFKSRSWSRERSPSLSLSVGRQSLQSSPNKLQINQKSSLLNAASPESKDILVERGLLFEGDAGSDTSKLDITTVDEGMDKDNYQRDDDNCAILRDTCEVNKSCTLENNKFTTGSLSQQSLTEEFHLPERALTPPKNPDREVSARSGTTNSMNITSEELYTVLRHYGLAFEHPEENEMGLSVETYFGSARLWPWEIIYYRRLKKGLITTENYARRVAQNKEFGIVDKYIRSSSGWGELGHQNS